MSTPTPTQNFVREVRNNSVYHTLIPNMTSTQRRTNASKISILLKRPGLIPSPEQEALGIHCMNPGQPHWIIDPSTGNRIFAGIFLDEKMTEPWHPQMLQLQRAAADALWDGESGRNQTVGISIQTGVGKIQPCATYPKGKEREREVMNVVGPMVMKEVFERWVPEEARGVMRATYERFASFANGGEDNVYSSSLQFNVSKPSAQGLDDIKDATDLHMDKGDDPQALSSVISLSRLPADIFPGYFAQTSLRTYSIMAPFCILIFPAWLPHKPIEPAPYTPRSIRYIPSMPIPPSNEDMPFLRITQVSYPNLIARTGNKPDMLRASMFTQEARMFYGSKRNFCEMLARKHARSIRERSDAKNTPIPSTTVDFLQQQYSFRENGKMQVPRAEKIIAVLQAPAVNPVLEAHKEVTRKISCGFSFANGQRRGVVEWVDRETGVWGDGVELPEEFFNKGVPATIGRKVQTRGRRTVKMGERRVGR